MYGPFGSSCDVWLNGITGDVWSLCFYQIWYLCTSFQLASSGDVGIPSSSLQWHVYAVERRSGDIRFPFQSLGHLVFYLGMLSRGRFLHRLRWRFMGRLPLRPLRPAGHHITEFQPVNPCTLFYYGLNCLHLGRLIGLRHGRRTLEDVHRRAQRSELWSRSARSYKP